jgi:hypothetical protein
MSVALEVASYEVSSTPCRGSLEERLSHARRRDVARVSSGDPSAPDLHLV